MSKEKGDGMDTVRVKIDAGLFDDADSVVLAVHHSHLLATAFQASSKTGASCHYRSRNYVNYD